MGEWEVLGVAGGGGSRAGFHFPGPARLGLTMQGGGSAPQPGYRAMGPPLPSTKEAPDPPQDPSPCQACRARALQPPPPRAGGGGDGDAVVMATPHPSSASSAVLAHQPRSAPPCSHPPIQPLSNPPRVMPWTPPPSSPPTTGCGPRASRTPQGLSPTEPSPPPPPQTTLQHPRTPQWHTAPPTFPQGPGEPPKPPPAPQTQEAESSRELSSL